MPDVIGTIRIINANGQYDIEASHFVDGSLDTPASWKAYIDAQAGAGFTFLVCSTATDTPAGVTFTPKGSSTPVTGTLAANNAVKGIYLVYHDHGGKDSYDEYIAAGPEGSKFWEKMGNTDIDLSGKVDKDTYTSEAGGAHTHTVSVPTISHTDTKLSASATQGAVTQPKDEVYGTATTWTTTVTPTTTNIKATASGATVGADGTASCLTGVKSTGSDTFVKAAIKSASLDVKEASASGYQAVVTASAPSLSGQTAVPTNAIKGGTVTGTAVGSVGVTSATSTTDAQFIIQPTVSADGVLSFSFGKLTSTAADLGFSGTAADTANVTVSAGATTKYINVATTAADSTGTAITGVAADGTATALTGVKVTAQPTVSLATGATAGTGVISVATGITSASTTASTNDKVNVVTNVSVANPTVELASGATGDVDVVSTISTGSTTATTSEHTGHTHDVDLTI